MGYRLGLAISIIIGVLVAAFPLYADNISKYIWNLDISTSNGGSVITHSLQGTVEEVDINESIIVVNGIEFKVLGTWITPDGTEIDSQDLLELIKPGDQVTVVYSQRGKWSYKLEEITIESTGDHYIRLS